MLSLFACIGNGNDGKDGENGKDGKDGATPSIGENGNWWIGDVDTGISATGSQGPQGTPGKDGTDGESGTNGLTPYIGANGNWWIGSVDTGISATGPQGPQGEPGKDAESGDGTDEGKEEFIPDITKENTVQTSEIPHVDYSDLAYGSYNTELFYQNSYEVPVGDPSVLVEEKNGETWFYVTGTSTGSCFEMWKTKDFYEWKKVGTIYSPAENFYGKSSFWAPQLFYDENASWEYYLGTEAGQGEGLYLLFFSARRESGACAVSVAFSKNVEGPYKNFVGTNSNGDYIDESNSLFEIEELKDLGLYKNHSYGDLYKKNRSFIDASPFVDPVSGDKYLYMVRNRNVDTSNDVWGVKLKDWVTPDYKTTTPLTAYGYTDIDKTEEYGYLSKNKIDEGPFLYYKDTTDDGIDNGKYYLAFSIGDTNDKIYPVCQAMSNSPLGPFTKIQPDDGGIINAPELAWDIHGSGHHCFFEVDGELYVAYHTYVIKTGNTIGRRYFAFDKIEWVYNENGLYLMRSNGPTVNPQPLPESASGYENLAEGATVTVSGGENDDTTVLNDGKIALRNGDEEMLFTFFKDNVITLTFDDYVTARAIMIYNSYEYSDSFLKIDRIEFSYRVMIDGKLYFGTAFIDDVGFNFKNALIPKSYLTAQGETDLYQMRPATAAIAEFDEIETNCIKIYLKNHNYKIGSALSEIVVLGKESATEITDESIGFGGYTHGAVFESYAGFEGAMPDIDNSSMNDLVSFDGKLTEKVWTDLATVTVIEGATIDANTKEPIDVEIYGEREARVYTYIGERAIYFAFDVTDKNLFFNDTHPQGRSTCVEIYFTTADNTEFNNKCYSIRINPIGEGEVTYNLGVYVAKDDGTEWRYSEIAHNVKIAVNVNGKVQTSADDKDYDSSKNVGYTVEIAVDKILVGLDADSIRFTAAFVQDKGYDEPRLNNNFIPNTHYTKPDTWIVFENKETA